MSDTTDRIKQVGAQVRDAAQRAADDVRAGDTGKVIDDARQKASELTAATSDKIDAAMDTTGEQMSNLADKVRQNAPSTGTVGNIASTTADYLDRGGQYLKENDLEQVRGNLETLIRQRPVETLLVGLGVGYLLARALRR